MGKISKRQPSKHSNHHDNPSRAKKAVIRRQHSQNVSRDTKHKLIGKQEQANSKSNSTKSSQPSKPRILFSRWDRVLLVGEGDFSFALSLAANHQVGSLTATCFDSRDALEQKYPAVSKTIQKLSPQQRQLEEAETRNHDHFNVVDDSGGAWEGFSPEVQDGQEAHDQKTTSDEDRHSSTGITVLYGVDATKLNSTHKKVLKRYSPFTKIVFNFPHVGGMSTDVNRQVRSNQQLLVSFFNAAKPLLATTIMPARPISVTKSEVSDDEMEDSHDLEHQQSEYLKHGQILVTLFEGEPYTLWNIRDLARHSGLKVLESYRFPWTAYPGYQHARTIGDIVTGKDRSNEGKRKGSWRGEERDARCYILALKDDDDGRPAPGSRKRKHAGDDSD